MPAWYVHMESARRTALRLENGTLPANFPIDATEAKGPRRDLPPLAQLPRPRRRSGPTCSTCCPTTRTTRTATRRARRSARSSAGSSGSGTRSTRTSRCGKTRSARRPTNSAQLASQLTGGLATQISDILNELSSAMTKAFEGLLAQPRATSSASSARGRRRRSRTTRSTGPTSSTTDARTSSRSCSIRTARRALDDATTDQERYDAESLVAFAVGWLTHCATDVTGHPFTNAKSGGPFRDHWQRHHLVELHIDSLNYSANHTGPCYGEIGESAVHFWTAFRASQRRPVRRTRRRAGLRLLHRLPVVPDRRRTDRHRDAKDVLRPRHRRPARPSASRAITGRDGHRPSRRSEDPRAGREL